VQLCFFLRLFLLGGVYPSHLASPRQKLPFRRPTYCRSPESYCSTIIPIYN
jgi:hypothetical protein